MMLELLIHLKTGTESTADCRAIIIIRITLNKE
jgi:hypothetical protein